MTITKTNFSSRIISLLLALITLFGAVGLNSATAEAASKTPAGAYVAVKNAYGKSFPLTSANRVTGRRVFGVKTSLVSSYYAASRTTGSGSAKAEYAIFICKAKNSKNARKVKSALKTYLKNEKNSMYNYLSGTGKTLFSKAKVGKKGKYVYLVMVDTSGNSKAVKAIKKSV